MTQKISYKLLDELGNRVAEVSLKQKNLGTIVIEHKGVFYRPLHYDLQNHLACCVPVEVIRVGEGNEVDVGAAGKPFAFVERKSG